MPSIFSQGHPLVFAHFSTKADFELRRAVILKTYYVIPSLKTRNPEDVPHPKMVAEKLHPF